MFDNEQLQKLYRYACVLTVDEQLAYDLLQDAVEKCLRQPPDRVEQLLSYTRTIIRNRFIDNIRKQQRFPHDSYEENDNAIDMDMQSLEDMVINTNELETIWPVLQPLEREILFLWAVEEYSTSEIAEQLAMPRGSILSRIHRMRKRIQENITTSGQGVVHE